MSVEIKDPTALNRAIRNRGGTISFNLPNGRFLVGIDKLSVKPDGTLVIDDGYLSNALDKEKLSIDEVAANWNCNC
jgi:hypothetical protein